MNCRTSECRKVETSLEEYSSNQDTLTKMCLPSVFVDCSPHCPVMKVLTFSKL